MPLPTPSRVLIDDLPAYSADIRSTFTGTLIFGVGLRDETVRTAGTAHLLEHLVMSRVGKVTIAHNATTADDTISFYAQGPPERVADFLSRVAIAVSTIHEVTEEDVAEQRRIIAAELGDESERHGRGPLLDRFGAQSIGLLDVGAPANRSLTREDALAFADTWLHRGNAALTFTGDIPDGLSVRLPAAHPLPERTVPAVIRHGAWVTNGTIPAAVSLVLQAGSQANLIVATALISRALEEELRTRRHLVYSVESFAAAMRAGERFVCCALDPRPEDAVAAASEALTTIRRMAEAGPTDDQLREELDQWTQAAEEPAVQCDYLDGLATSILRGRRDPADLAPPDPDEVTAESLRDTVSRALPSLFVTFADEAVGYGDEAVTAALGLPPVEGEAAHLAGLSKMQIAKHLLTSGVETFSPRMFRGMRGCELIIDHVRLTSVSPNGLLELRFDQIAMASFSERHQAWVLLALGGDALAIELGDWRRADLAHGLLDERIPREVQFRVDIEQVVS
jgi:hypothetical protein